MTAPIRIDEELKSQLQDRRPPDTDFKQQRLYAWQPILNASVVLPGFILVGLSFIAIGLGLYYNSHFVQELSLDYTENCKIITPITIDSVTYQSCKDYLEDLPHANAETCRCKLDFYLDTAFERQVYLYYGLTNFYQNHRRYTSSKDDSQLGGREISDPSQLSGNCNPYRYSEGNKLYAPCGAIANSLFSDKIDLQYHPDGDIGPVMIKLSGKGIAWNTDKNVKFANPVSWNNSVKPPYWDRPAKNLSDDPLNNGYNNEDLIVWMRPAAFPTFGKFYRKVEMIDGIGLKKGNYSFLIDYKFPVTQFRGSKRVILTTTSFMGCKNPFLGVAYLVVGSICLLLGVFLTVVHVRVGKKHEALIKIDSRTEY